MELYDVWIVAFVTPYMYTFVVLCVAFFVAENFFLFLSPANSFDYLFIHSTWIGIANETFFFFCWNFSNDKIIYVLRVLALNFWRRNLLIQRISHFRNIGRAMDVRALVLIWITNFMDLLLYSFNRSFDRSYLNEVASTIIIFIIRPKLTFNRSRPKLTFNYYY